MEHAYWRLGATLYMPATRPDLGAILNGEKLPGVRSLALCTEDAILERELHLAVENLAQGLAEAGGRRPGLVFIRPRSPEVLQRLLRLPGIEQIDGFVLPKLDERSLAAYAACLEAHPRLLLMPILETEIAFRRARLEVLAERLAALPNPVTCVRIGGNDLLQLLGMKRPKATTLYETPLRAVVNDILLSFAPLGFRVSAPVFEYLDNPELLQREVAQDVQHGLFAKTAIHPMQVSLIERAYQVAWDELHLARQIVDPSSPAVFRAHGQMVEPATHRRWAQETLLRADYYGVSGEATEVAA